jgi:hypothetical protein
MPALIPPRFPVDLTGVALSNRVVDEPHSMVRRQVRSVVLQAAPFFKKNVVIVDALTNVALTNSQYKCFNIISLPSALAGPGNDVYGVIVITDQAVSDNVRVTYQSVGGEYVQSFEVIKTLIDTLSLDDRPPTWPNVLNRPSTFNPVQHLHAIGDVIGWEYLVVVLEQLKQTIAMGDEVGRNAMFAYIDSKFQAIADLFSAATSPSALLSLHVANTSNPHATTKTDIGLSLVQNYGVATLLEARAGAVSNKYMTADLVREAASSMVPQYAAEAIANAYAQGHANGVLGIP